MFSWKLKLSLGNDIILLVGLQAQLRFYASALSTLDLFKKKKEKEKGTSCFISNVSFRFIESSEIVLQPPWTFLNLHNLISQTLNCVCV